MSNVPTPTTQQPPAAARPVSGVTALIESDKFKTRLLGVLPPDINVDRFVGVAKTAVALKPELGECAPTSFGAACIQLAQVGLIPDGRLANLVPFNQKNQATGHWEKHCRLMMDYKGWIQVLWKSQNFLKLHADIVFTNDEFEENCGVIDKHIKAYKTGRGEPYLAYFDVITKDGIHMSTVLHQSEIEDIRNKFSRDWQKPSSPWQKRPLEMWKKTAVNQAIKGLPYLFSISDKVADLQEAEVDTIDFRNVSEAVPVESAQPAQPAQPEFREQKPETALPAPAQEPTPTPEPASPTPESAPVETAAQEAPAPTQETPPVVEAELVEEAPPPAQEQTATEAQDIKEATPAPEPEPEQTDAFGKPDPTPEGAPAPAQQTEPAPAQESTPAPQPTTARNPFAELNQ